MRRMEKKGALLGAGIQFEYATVPFAGAVEEI